MRASSVSTAHRWRELALALGGSLTSAAWFLTCDNDQGDAEKRRSNGERCYSRVDPKQPLRAPVGTESASRSHSHLLATSARVDDQSTSISESQQDPVYEQVKTMEYDFIVLGNGNAGLSAVRTLREKCPTAKIASVDPVRPITSTTKKLDYWPHFATGFDPVTRTVQLSDETHQLRYRYGILVATGARGAPPPPSLLDDETLDRVLELRSTTCTTNDKHPIMSPNTVRQMTLMAASQGARVGVMGSGWEAVELAVAAASVDSGKAPMLTFGSAGPLSHILPRYLSTAVTKRLRQQGVDIHPRSLVRYVAMDHNRSKSQLELHTAKSYDMLDTKRTTIDLLVGEYLLVTFSARYRMNRG